MPETSPDLGKFLCPAFDSRTIPLRMSHPHTNEQPAPANRNHFTDPRELARSKTWRLTVASSLVIVGALAVNSCSKSPTDSPTAPATPASTNVSLAANTAAVTNTTSENLLNGNWVRPDGGYVIEVRAAQSDGRLDAYYFNPRPINVARAEWRRENDGLHVFMELRDQNYPGATYKLRYLPREDQLAGEYYQPVYQQTFDVQFIRQNR
jgi:hypothetical protein